MPSILSRLPVRGKTSPSLSTTQSNVTTDSPRALIGSAADHLQDAMTQMYWTGVRRELHHILLTLQEWRAKEEYSKTVLPDEEDLQIHGYDTFLDQVSQSSHKFRNRNDKWARLEELRKRNEKNTSVDHLPTYAEALQDRGWDILADMQSTSISQDIRADLRARKPEKPDILRRRARMLLQAAQFLDMDKGIEYRDAGPDKDALKPASKQQEMPPAQMTLSHYDESDMPVFAPLTCHSCREAIRGSMFRHTKENDDMIVCEGCYWKHHYNHPDMTKVYKQCCLRKAISPRDSQKICSCIDVRRREADGKFRDLFPVEDPAEHLNPEGSPGKVRCGLFELGDRVAEAKAASTLPSVPGKKKKLSLISSGRTVLSRRRNQASSLLGKCTRKTELATLNLIII